MRITLALTMVMSLLFSGAAFAQGDGGGSPGDDQVELIPRQTLFGNPEKANPDLSPDGEYLTYLAPWEGTLNVWIRTVGEEDDRPLTKDQDRGIQTYTWTHHENTLLYLQDTGGDENWRIYGVNIETGETTEYTPEFPDVQHEVQAQIVKVSDEVPDAIMIGLNKRDQRIHDLYRLDLETGETELVKEGKVDWGGWLVDNDLNLRGFMKSLDNGGMEVHLRGPEEENFEKFKELAPKDTLSSGPLGFNQKDDTLYMIDSTGRDTGALVAHDLEEDSSEVLASDPEYDVAGVWSHPKTHVPQAVTYNKARTEIVPLDDELKDDLEKIRETHEGDPGLTGRSLDDSTWLVYYNDDDGPISYYSFDRESLEMEHLFDHRPELNDVPLAEMEPIQYEARDGVTIHGYLTKPKNFDEPGPLVLAPHGGPWYRDEWGYDPIAQWLANRGYAVLQPNFRGSTGYGKEFINMADREWGGDMQDDLTDAVNWAVEEGIADPDKVCIFGGSYGGYATLAGVTFTPDLYACGISIVGPSNLVTFLKTIPPYWESFRNIMNQRVGELPRYEEGPKQGQFKAEEDWTEEDREQIEFLKSRSPLFHVENIDDPLLIGQGANDPRVDRNESLQIVNAMKEKGLKVEYIEYKNEGHGFVRPENRLHFFANAEEFLHEVLGGRYEPYHGDVPDAAEIQRHGEDESADGAAQSAAKQAGEKQETGKKASE